MTLFGPIGADVRHYSLSGSPYADTYRISVKREHLGLVSNYLADSVDVGATVMTRHPSGEFVMAKGTSPQAIVNMFSSWYRDLGLIGCSSHSGRV